MRHNFGDKTAWKTEKEFEGQYNDVSQVRGYEKGRRMDMNQVSIH
jgi:hypothetical protein